MFGTTNSPVTPCSLPRDAQLDDAILKAFKFVDQSICAVMPDGTTATVVLLKKAPDGEGTAIQAAPFRRYLILTLTIGFRGSHRSG